MDATRLDLAITRLRFATRRDSAFDGHVRVWLSVPVEGGFDLDLLDRDVVLPPSFDVDLAPIDAFAVGSSQPRGDYALHCAIADRDGNTDAQSAAFRLE